MTRAEAIEILKELWRYEKSDKYTDGEIREAISVAISSLETDETRTIVRNTMQHFDDWEWECPFPYLGG